MRRQVAAGAEIVLVPSCTDTLAGYHRVMLSCRARALESQCFVAQASTVCDAPWSLALDHNVGAAGLYGPVEQSFVSDGVVAQGPLHQPGWLIADLNREAIARARREEQVTNFADWDNALHASGEVGRVRL